MNDNSPGRKSLKVSTPVHSAVHDLATRLGKTANEAISLLVDESTVRLPLSTEQHARWTAVAQAAGLPLPEWIMQQCEAGIRYGGGETIVQIFRRVDMLCHHFGLTEKAAAPPRRGWPATDTIRNTEYTEHPKEN